MDDSPKRPIIIAVMGSCSVCYRRIPIAPLSTTDVGPMCLSCQHTRPARKRLLELWKKRERELLEELNDVRLAIDLTPQP